MFRCCSFHGSVQPASAVTRSENLSFPCVRLLKFHMTIQWMTYLTYTTYIRWHIWNCKLYHWKVYLQHYWKRFWYIYIYIFIDYIFFWMFLADKTYCDIKESEHMRYFTCSWYKRYWFNCKGGTLNGLVFINCYILILLLLKNIFHIFCLFCSYIFISVTMLVFIKLLYFLQCCSLWGVLWKVNIDFFCSPPWLKHQKAPNKSI